MRKTYHGSCHCGAVHFDAEIDLAAGTSRCNCSICGKGRFWKAIVPASGFHLRRGADDLTTYRFGSRTIRHRFCRHCGIHAFYQPRSDPENYSVNARCLDEYDPATMQPKRLFEGKNWEDAYARRKDEWEAKP